MALARIDDSSTPGRTRAAGPALRAVGARPGTGGRETVGLQLSGHAGERAVVVAAGRLCVLFVPYDSVRLRGGRVHASEGVFPAGAASGPTALLAWLLDGDGAVRW